MQSCFSVITDDEITQIIIAVFKITCKHLVRTGFSSYGRGQTLHLSRAETTVTINTKFWTNDYIRQIKRIAKFRGDRFMGAAPHVGQVYSSRFSVFFLYFFLLLLLISSTHLQTTIRNGFWRMMAQKTWFGVRICLMSIWSVKINL